MSQIIDRRLNSRHKSAVNRQRFIKRFKQQIKKSVSDAIAGRSITDVSSGEKVNIPKKDLSEPTFSHAPGGKRDIVLPGNKDFVRGDTIRKPKQGSGQDSSASQDGEGNDEFSFEISREEFLEVFFEDLELPDLIKKQLSTTPTLKSVRAGYVKDGAISNLNLVKSLTMAISRKIAIGGSYKKEIEELEEEIKKTKDNKKKEKLKLELEALNRKKKTIPFIDPFDLRYNNKIQVPHPNTQAVMFCLMDVSGSMDESKKDIAKRFFILLYLFLNKNYKKITVIFIRHHTSAKEVNEQEFFYSRETGGTVVSSALELMSKIIEERFSVNNWNIYAAQASDGDNWHNDSPKCAEILKDKILPIVQYFAYVEIMPRQHQSLWECYEHLRATSHNFAMQSISDQKDIYPIFRELFKKSNNSKIKES